MQRELDEWLRELIMQAEVNKQPSWHLRRAKAGMHNKQLKLTGDLPSAKND